MKPDNQNQFLGSLTHKTKGQETVNIQTIVKVRPMLANEINESNCMETSDNTLQISGGYYNTIRKKLDRVFGPESTQLEVYDYLSPSIARAVEGYNVTIFSYGQTGSGKTHTMFGSDWDNMINGDYSKKKQNTFYRDIVQDVNFAGVIPRCVDHLFNKLLKDKKNVTVYCSFLQLYNEKLIDLLGENDKQQLIIHENKQDGIYVQGLSQHKVKNSMECMALMQKGEKNRCVRQTSYNVKSSRSHSVFQLLIEEVFPSTQSFKRSKINLCDLAGSQKINKSEQIELQHFKQLKNINLSLTTLGKLIHILSSNKPSVATYRQSKLTRLLQDSLGGNAMTVIIANVNSKQSCIEQTLNTLKFVERARQVTTEISIKTYENKPEVKQLQQQVNYLKNILKIKRKNSTFQNTASQFKEKISRLESENRKLKQQFGEEGDKGLITRLLEQNELMKKQLERRDVQRERINSNRFSSIDIVSQNSKYKRTPSQIDSKSNTSHTLQKGCSQSRYTNYSSLSKKFGAVPPDQNIIVKRLQKLQKIKQENRQKLNRQLKQIEKSQQLIMSKLKNTALTNKGESVSVYQRLHRK